MSKEDQGKLYIHPDLPSWNRSLNLNKETIYTHLISRSEWISLASHPYTIVDIELSHFDIKDHSIVRISPRLEGIPIIGADVALSLHHPSKRWTYVKFESKHAATAFTSLKKRGIEDSFPLTLQDAIEKSQLRLNVHELHSEKMWYMQSKHLIPAWKVRDLREHEMDRKVMYISAVDGSVLACIPLVHFEQGYAYPPNQQPSFGSQPSLLEIKNLNSSSTDNGGYSIKGSDFKSFSACFAYVCANGALDCDMSQTICVDPTPSMIEGKDYLTSSYTFTIDGKSLDYDKDWAAQGYTNGKVYLKWQNEIIFAPRIKRPRNGIWGSDINFASYSLADPRDTLAELQTFVYLNDHLDFLKSLLKSPSFCLIGSGPDCKQVDPVTNRSASSFDSPMPFVVNMQKVKIFDTDPKYPSFAQQLQKGLGKSSSSPVVFYESEGFPNAYFSNSQTQITDAMFSNCRNGSCVSIRDSKLGYIAFGQTSETDYSMNNCVVFHELTHALVAKYIPNLEFYTWTPQGLSSESGALNEGWADYFAAINCGYSDFTKTFNSIPSRNLNNDKTCADYTGQVHHDSLIFSGALWEIRKSIKSNMDKYEFDILVLHGMALGNTKENFSTQFKTLLTLLTQHSKLSSLYSFAKSVFDKRVLECDLISPILPNKPISLYLQSNSYSPNKMSALPTQLKLQPRYSDWSMKLTWRQTSNSPSIGTVDFGYAKVPLSAFVAYQCPLDDVGTGTQRCRGDASSTIKPILAEYDSKTKQGQIVLNLGPDNAPVYIAMYHQLPTTMLMLNTTVSFTGFTNYWMYALMAFGVLCLPLLIYVVTRLAIGYSQYQIQKKLESQPFGEDLVYDKNKQSSLVAPAVISSIFNLNEGKKSKIMVLSHSILTFILFILSGTLAALSLYKDNIISEWICILPLTLLILIDFPLGLYGQYKTDGNRFSGFYNIQLGAFLLVSLLLCIVCIVCAWVIWSFIVSLWVHKMMFGIFILVALLRIGVMLSLMFF